MGKLIPTDNQWIFFSGTFDSTWVAFQAVCVESFANGDEVERRMYENINSKFGELNKLLVELRVYQTEKAGEDD